VPYVDPAARSTRGSNTASFESTRARPPTGPMDVPPRNDSVVRSIPRPAVARSEPTWTKFQAVSAAPPLQPPPPPRDGIHPDPDTPPPLGGDPSPREGKARLEPTFAREVAAPPGPKALREVAAPPESAGRAPDALTAESVNRPEAGPGGLGEGEGA